MPALERICQQAGVALIEDAAQAVGARDVLGRRAGSIGVAGCHSFFPAKNFGALGDGGAVTTSDAALADRITMLRQHAARPKYHHEEIGGNWRLDALQSALLRVKLPHLHEWTTNRRHAAKLYREALTDAGLPGWLELPEEGQGYHVYNQFVVRVPAREAVRQELAALGVPTMVYYPEPLALQPCFASLGLRPGQFPNAERASEQVLALPMFPFITEDEVHRVAQALLIARAKTHNPAGKPT
jgi:dTDP-4-amino-4,6-dideoxygalactose transaminase